MISKSSLFAALLLAFPILPAAAQNLIPNPSFEQGNTGFTSDYHFMDQSSPLIGGQRTTPGNFAIDENPNVYGTQWPSSITPHSGSKMLIVDGAYDSNMQAWISPAIPVQPHRKYDFTVFATALYPDNPPALQFRINGQQIGTVFSPGQPPGRWTQFSDVWDSGASSAAVITVSDQDTQGWGNDFALDDLSFAKQPWSYYAENWTGDAWHDLTGWVSRGGIFGFGLAVFGVGLAILGIGLAALGVQLASLLAGED